MPRFLCDGMLGSLARWLRILGYDAEFDTVSPDGDLARRGGEQGRWLLTKDRALAALGPRSMLVRSEGLEDQLVEVLSRLNLRPSPENLGTRCTECNGVVGPVERDTVHDLVPPFVWETVDEMRRCESCGKVYWRGTHVQRIEERVRRVLDRVEGGNG
jgi:uncharacterized protein with PIN domain